MRAEKQNLTKEYLARLNASPFFIVVNYRGLKVAHLTELRKRLNKAGAEIHVVKNSVFLLAAKEAGVGDLNGALGGQLAVVTGKRDISTAAKVVKTFGTELDRLKVHFGYLNNQRLEQPEIMMLADLPSMEVLRAQTPRFVQRPGFHVRPAAEYARRPDGAGAAGPRRQTARSGPARGGAKIKPISAPLCSQAGMEINKQQRKSSVRTQRT